MSKVIGIDMGHPFNCGAFGIMSETDGNRAVGNLVISKLQSVGYVVVNCTYDTNVNELGERVKLANAQHLDLYVSLHMDSWTNSTSSGVTVYTTSGSSAKGIATEIVNKVAELGYNNRGLKEANFKVLRDTDAPALLLEMGFVTSTFDCNLFNAEDLATKIVEAITGQSVVTPAETPRSKYGYVVTAYLPDGYQGNKSFVGIDADYVLSYFDGIRCYFRGNEYGVWLETQVLPIEDCNKLKAVLGSWFYEIKES